MFLSENREERYKIPVTSAKRDQREMEICKQKGPKRNGDMQAANRDLKGQREMEICKQQSE